MGQLNLFPRFARTIKKDTLVPSEILGAVKQESLEGLEAISIGTRKSRPENEVNLVEERRERDGSLMISVGPWIICLQLSRPL